MPLILKVKRLKGQEVKRIKGQEAKKLRDHFHLFTFSPFHLFTFSLLFTAYCLLTTAYCYSETFLIETDELEKNLGSQNLRIMDAESKELYERAHIPYALNLHGLQLNDPELGAIGFPIDPKKAEEIFGGIGIDNDTKVVVYDNGDGRTATSIWYTLMFFGHKDVKVMNGGFRKWVKEGRPITQEIPNVNKKRFVAKPQKDMSVESSWIFENFIKNRRKDLVIIDARSFEEFKGVKKGEGGRGGHIPGALNLEWNKASGKIETFKPKDQITQLLKKSGVSKDKEVVTYCNIGAGRGTYMYFLLRRMGYEKVRLYDGSWEDWGGNIELPVER